MRRALRALVMALGAIFAVTGCPDVKDSSTSATTTGGGSATSSSATSTGEEMPVLACSEALDRELCEMAVDPEGRACAWLKVYSMSFIGGICAHEFIKRRCFAVVPDGGWCPLHHPEDDRYVLYPDGFMIADEGWVSCCGDPPPSALCSCLTSM